MKERPPVTSFPTFLRTSALGSCAGVELEGLEAFKDATLGPGNYQGEAGEFSVSVRALAEKPRNIALDPSQSSELDVFLFEPLPSIGPIL